MKSIEERVEEFREEANFINKRYGISDLDHDSALCQFHIYDLMREYAKQSVSAKLEEAERHFKQQMHFSGNFQIMDAYEKCANKINSLKLQ